MNYPNKIIINYVLSSVYYALKQGKESICKYICRHICMWIREFQFESRFELFSFFRCRSLRSLGNFNFNTQLSFLLSLIVKLNGRKSTLNFTFIILKVDTINIWEIQKAVNNKKHRRRKWSEIKFLFFSH